MKILFLIFLCVSTLWAHRIAGVSLDSVDVVYEEKLESGSLHINLKFISPGKLEKISVRGSDLFIDIKKDELSVLDGILICGMWVKKNNRSYEVYFDTPQSYTKGVLSFNGNEGYKVEKKEDEKFIQLQTRDKFFQFSSSAPTSYFSLKEIKRNTSYYLILNDYSISFNPF